MTTYTIPTPAALLRFYDTAKHEEEKDNIMEFATAWENWTPDGSYADDIAMLKLNDDIAMILVHLFGTWRVLATLYPAAARDIAKELTEA